VAVSPKGESLYVTSRNDNSVLQYDVGSAGALSPKSPATVAADADPYSVAVRPPPTSQKQCRRRGWKQFGFKNAGQCYRFVKRGSLK
jgi:hypothetical protein